MGKLCDKEYAGDSGSGKIIGVFRCEPGYRLVFDTPDHQDYYLNEKGEYVASCPPKSGNEECHELLKSCEFVNLCRS